MPRPWSDYTLREWLRITPFEQRYNYALYQLKARPVAWRAPERGDIADLRCAVSGRRVLITVAFHDAEFIDWQAVLLKRFVPDYLHLVVDNSLDRAAAAEIERVAKARGSQYVKLRPPPWRRTIDGGRAHASAMNWTWRNVLKPGRPSAFGFIDHDLFPMRPSDPFAPLADHPMGGLLRNGSHADRWFLWAGYCFYRFEAVENARLDFSVDWNAGLDTGGANWFSLYSRLGSGQVFNVGKRLEGIADDVPLELARFEWLGDWLHYSNFSTPYDLEPTQREALGARKRALLLERLKPVLAA
jgi:hypothetical protein